MKRLSRKRRPRECRVHIWSTMIVSGLRRDLCATCGAISLRPLNHQMTIPPGLQDSGRPDTFTTAGV